MAVEFQNQPHIKQAAKVNQKKTMADRLVDWKIAKDTKQANLYMLVLSLIFFGLAMFIFFT